MIPLNPKTGRPDFLRGDHSWKRWFYEMTHGDKFLYYFIFTLIIIIIELCFLPGICSIVADNYIESGLFVAIACVFAFCIPILSCLAFGYFGLYRSWEEMKGN